MRISDTTIYLTDNGRALCGAHLGASARLTGRDISGQPIEPVGPEEARYFVEALGGPICCERCGLAASLLVTA
jgi:hypothetical protein